MQKELAVLFVMAGLMLSAHRPLTKSELDTVRVRLEARIDAVDGKIDRLSRQVQVLDEKMGRLDRRFSALEKHLNIGQGQKPAEAQEKTVPMPGWQRSDAGKAEAMK